VSKLSFILLDEPIQTLDDVHFLGLLGLIKRIAFSSQVIFSTADRNIAELTQRQMRGLRGIRQYVGYEWRNFDPQEGPEVVVVEERSVTGWRRGETATA